jgi:hypothetical protein
MVSITAAGMPRQEFPCTSAVNFEKQCADPQEPASFPLL